MKLHLFSTRCRQRQHCLRYRRILQYRRGKRRSTPGLSAWGGEQVGNGWDLQTAGLPMHLQRPDSLDTLGKTVALGGKKRGMKKARTRGVGVVWTAQSAKRTRTRRIGSGGALLTELLLLVHEGGARRPDSGLKNTLVDTVGYHYRETPCDRCEDEGGTVGGERRYSSREIGRKTPLGPLGPLAPASRALRGQSTDPFTADTGPNRR